MNTPYTEDHPSISADGLSLYFYSDRPGGFGNSDLYVVTRQVVGNPWGPPVNVSSPVNSSDNEHCPFLSPDGLSLFFSRMQPYTMTSDIWVSKRKATTSPWGIPVLFRPVNSAIAEYHLSYSAADPTLYFTRADNVFGVYDLWQVQVFPIVDFNGDGQVEGKDVLVMAKCWGGNESLCDIGPSVWGDGVVDVNDLIVLAEHIGEEVFDPTLILHWALDETEGVTAHDGAGTNDGVTVGNPAWEPEGTIGGALAFDGKDDLVHSGLLVLDPSLGPFSVIAWVKGGARGQVIVSQASGADWLHLNQDGMLTTDLKSTSRSGKSLTSSAFVIDDQWHRVVLTWDGTNRTLQMDGVEVARDTQPNLAASNGNLQIGVGKYVGTTTFWTGLIDDVRIYNRAVQP
ncbi:MAG: PD40 domain-containing protein [Sedimentisphaerales bacterium]|nr:PD40 domain-containing protein [Sedimentisphaerales bacterium]